jgi:hypothetical protein
MASLPRTTVESVFTETVTVKVAFWSTVTDVGAKWTYGVAFANAVGNAYNKMHNKNNFANVDK